MPTLTLNDGTQYELDWCNADKGIFNINLVTEESFLNLAMKFSNPECTSHITSTHNCEDTRTYDGYTELRYINVNSWRTGTTLICLTKPGLEI